MPGGSMLVGLPRAQPALQGTRHQAVPPVLAICSPWILGDSALAKAGLGWGCDSAVKLLPQQLQGSGTRWQCWRLPTPGQQGLCMPAGDVRVAGSSS